MQRLLGLVYVFKLHPIHLLFLLFRDYSHLRASPFYPPIHYPPHRLYQAFTQVFICVLYFWLHGLSAKTTNALFIPTFRSYHLDDIHDSRYFLYSCTFMVPNILMVSNKMAHLYYFHILSIMRSLAPIYCFYDQVVSHTITDPCLTQSFIHG